VLNTILVDTGPLTALFGKDDKYHHKILEFIKGKKFRFVTTTAVVTEVTHLLDFSVDAQIDFFRWILNNGVQLEEVGISDISRIMELTKKYSDQSYGLCRCNIDSRCRTHWNQENHKY
jgi:predicted nucleic acid-binding protein